MNKKGLIRLVISSLISIAAIMAVQSGVLGLTVDKECNWECGQAYHYCLNNPDGAWIGHWINRECQDNETWTFCDNFECPNSTQLYSQCLENPTLPGCNQGEEDPIASFCQETQAAGCQSDCENDSRGTCVESHVTDNGSAQCFCTYTLCSGGSC